MSSKYEKCISKYRIEYPSKKVDNEPPKLVFAMRSCIGDAHRMDTIMAENKVLLQRLCTIYRSNGAVDSSPPRCVYTSNFSDRLRKIVRIERENIDILCQIHQTEPAVPTVKFCNKEWRRLLQDLNNQSKYPFQFASKEREWLPLPSLVPQKRRDEYAPRARVFMEFTSSQGRFLGKIEFELFLEKAPKLCDNFLAFVSGKGPDDLSYQDSGFYQILPGYFVMGGDILKNNGSGVVSIDGEVPFVGEKNDLSHCEPGILCTPGFDSDSCDSKFMITVKPLTILDDRSTVFGRVLLGHEVLIADRSVAKFLRSASAVVPADQASTDPASADPQNADPQNEEMKKPSASVNQEIYERLTELLPSNYKYKCDPEMVREAPEWKNCFYAEIRADIRCKNRALQWLADFRKTSFSEYKSRGTYAEETPKIVYKINECGSKPSGKVSTQVFCSNCGALKVPKKNRHSKSTSDSPSYDDNEG